MLSYPAARERALRRAIETGQLAEMDLIHEIQRSDGMMPCFGRMVEPCERLSCRWYGECMALLEVRAIASEPVFA